MGVRREACGSFRATSSPIPMHSRYRAGRAAAHSRVPQFRDGKFVTRTTRTLRAIIQGMHCKWLGDVNRLQRRIGGSSYPSIFANVSPSSFPQLFLSIFSRLENDDEFEWSFPPIFRFSKGTQRVPCWRHCSSVCTWFTCPPSFTFPPSLPMPPHNWANAHVCRAAERRLVYLEGGFLGQGARAAPRPSNRKKSEIENPEDTHYDKSSPLSSLSMRLRMSQNALTWRMCVMRCLSRQNKF